MPRSAIDGADEALVARIGDFVDTKTALFLASGQQADYRSREHPELGGVDPVRLGITQTASVHLASRRL